MRSGEAMVNVATLVFERAEKHVLFEEDEGRASPHIEKTRRGSDYGQRPHTAPALQIKKCSPIIEPGASRPAIRAVRDIRTMKHDIDRVWN